MAVKVRPLVDGMKAENPSGYDRFLIVLALLAPLTMLGLAKWRASLEVPYVQASELHQVFDNDFVRATDQWLSTRLDRGSELILMVDPACPCTRATLSSIDQAMQRSSALQAKLTVVEFEQSMHEAKTLLAEVQVRLPATPTLLAVRQGQLVYAGPVNSGSFCTRSVRQILGLDVLTADAPGVMLNWLSSGCYCRRQASASAT